MVASRRIPLRSVLYLLGLYLVIAVMSSAMFWLFVPHDDVVYRGDVRVVLHQATPAQAISQSVAIGSLMAVVPVLSIAYLLVVINRLRP